MDRFPARTSMCVRSPAQPMPFKASAKRAASPLRLSRQARRRELARPCAQTVAPFPRLALRCSAPRDGLEGSLNPAIHGLHRGGRHKCRTGMSTQRSENRAVSDAEKRSRTAEQAPTFEHKDVRVRRGRRSASIAGQSRQHDVAEAIAPSAIGFGYFPRKESDPLAREASGKRHGCRTSSSESGTLVRTPAPTSHSFSTDLLYRNLRRVRV
jgi:hypothetical protein